MFSLILKETCAKDPYTDKPHKGKTRKEYGSTWWGKAFLRSMESACSEKVSSLGKASALAGKVYDVSVRMGCIKAKAEGPLGEEYNVVIRFDKLAGTEKKGLLSIVSEPGVSLALLSNELPASYESGGFGALFGDYRPACTCPDGGLCIHTAAVFYVLSAEIDHAPQMLFFLRGISNDQLLSSIRGGVR